MHDHIIYIHMVFGKDEGLPEHYSNSNVYMNVGNINNKVLELIVVKAPSPQNYKEYSLKK